MSTLKKQLNKSPLKFNGGFQLSEIMVIDNMTTAPSPSREYIDFMEICCNGLPEHNVAFVWRVDGVIKKVFMVPYAIEEELNMVIHGITTDLFSMHNVKQLYIGVDDERGLTVLCKFNDGQESSLTFGYINDEDWEDLQERDGTKDLSEEIMEVLEYAPLSGPIISNDGARDGIEALIKSLS